MSAMRRSSASTTSRLRLLGAAGAGVLVRAVDKHICRDRRSSKLSAATRGAVVVDAILCGNVAGNGLSHLTTIPDPTARVYD